MTLRYEDLYPDQLDALLAENPVAYVPVAAVEYHGLHLPFGVDLWVAAAIALHCAEQCGGVVLPAAPYCCEGQDSILMPNRPDARGTLYLGDRELYRRWLTAVLAAADRQGFRHIFVVSGHLGPIEKETADQIAADWRGKNGARAHHVNYSQHTDLVDHAGKGETALIRALRPAMVRDDQIAREPKESHRRRIEEATAEFGRHHLARILDGARRFVLSRLAAP